MHTVPRPASEPVELAELRGSGVENFGSLNRRLDDIFGGVCAYCERLPLWRADQEGLGIEDTDLPDVPGQLFTCDHLKPRRLLCNNLDPNVGQCKPTTPPHTQDCTIYDWDNLVYGCQACNGVKGGQWPDSHSADAYIHPCAELGSGIDPDSVFVYDLNTGEIVIREGIAGIIRSNALSTIKDLALNYPRPPIETPHFRAKERTFSLADYRKRWIQDLEKALDSLIVTAPHFLSPVVNGLVSRRERFSSISRQFIESSRYRSYIVDR